MERHNKGPVLTQQQLNIFVGIFIFALFLIGVPWLFGVEVLPFVGNFLVYVILVVGVGVAMPIFLGFLWRYFAVQALDDAFGRQNENMPDGLHFWLGVVSSVAAGFLWEALALPLISQAHALNTWAWEWIQFRTVYEGYTAWGWVLVVFVMFAIGYFIGHMTEYEKYRSRFRNE